jgi:hypothetical protein
VKSSCSEIIEEMRSLFNDLYLHVRTDDLTSDIQSMVQERREQYPRVEGAREKLRSSKVFLDVIEKYLESE